MFPAFGSGETYRLLPSTGSGRLGPGVSGSGLGSGRSAPAGGGVLVGSTPAVAIVVVGRTPAVVSSSTITAIVVGSAPASIAAATPSAGVLFIFVIGVVVELDLAVFGDIALQVLRNSLLALEKDLDQVGPDVGVTVVEERGGETLVADTCGTAWVKEVSREISFFNFNSGLLPSKSILPMRWMYSSIPPWSMLGKSKLTTCMTRRISRPRAETAVATMMGDLAVRKARLKQVLLVLFLLYNKLVVVGFLTWHPHAQPGYDPNGSRC